MKHLYFIRHGEQDNAGRYFSLAKLTELGIKQAELAGIGLKHLGCQKLYSSDLPRARQTSLVINNYLSAKVSFLTGFREINYGDWDGMTAVVVKQKYGRLFEKMKKKEADIPYPNGESGHDVFSRAQKALEKHVYSDDDERIGIVTHGELILSIICGIQKIKFEKRFDVAWLDHCGITLILYSQKTNEMKIKYINDTSHLDVLK